MGVSIKPLADRVLIEPVAAETKTASGLYIPDTDDCKSWRYCTLWKIRRH